MIDSTGLAVYYLGRKMWKKIHKDFEMVAPIEKIRLHQIIEDGESMGVTFLAYPSEKCIVGAVTYESVEYTGLAQGLGDIVSPQDAADICADIKARLKSFRDWKAGGDQC